MPTIEQLEIVVKKVTEFSVTKDQIVNFVEQVRGKKLVGAVLSRYGLIWDDEIQEVIPEEIVE